MGMGMGMGMIFVPLFDVIMGEVRDHEVGSASALLESLQQLGVSLEVAVLGAIFFATISVPPHPAAFSEGAALLDFAPARASAHDIHVEQPTWPAPPRRMR
jgi:hypothetical protein